MTRQDIEKIETQLSIKLPGHYISFVLDFPKALTAIQTAFEDPASSAFYNNAQPLILLNEHLRFHTTETFIKKMFCIGENGGGDYHLINLENPADEQVHIFDHEEPIGNNFATYEGFERHENLQEFKTSILALYGDPYELEQLANTAPEALQKYLSNLKTDLGW